MTVMTLYRGMEGGFWVQLPGESTAVGRVFQRKSGRFGVALISLDTLPDGRQERGIQAFDVPRKSFATMAKAIGYIERFAEKLPATAAPAPAKSEPTVAEVKAFMEVFGTLSKELALPTSSQVDVGLTYTTATTDDAWRAEKALVARFPTLRDGVHRDGPTLGITVEDAAAWLAHQPPPAAPAAPVKPVFTSKASSKLDSLGRMAQLRDYYNDGSGAYFSALIEAVKAGHIWPSAIVGGGLKNPKQAALTYLAGKLMDASVVSAPAAPAAPAPEKSAEVQAVEEAVGPYLDSGEARMKFLHGATFVEADKAQVPGVKAALDAARIPFKITAKGFFIMGMPIEGWEPAQGIGAYLSRKLGPQATAGG